jgi:hypothetical protein
MVSILLRHNPPRPQRHQAVDRDVPPGWLVSVGIRTEAEDQSARNLFMQVGAKEISSATDGRMIPIERRGSA